MGFPDKERTKVTIHRPRPFLLPMQALLLLLTIPAIVRSEPTTCAWPQWRGPNHNGIVSNTGFNFDWKTKPPVKRWQIQVGIGFSSIAVCDGKVFTMGHRDEKDLVYCLDLKTGHEHWTHSYDAPLDDGYYEGGPNATPSVEGDRVYTLGKHGQVYCLDVNNGDVVWQQNLEQLGLKPPDMGFSGGPLLWKDRLFFNAGSAGIALEKSDGGVAWKSDPGPASYAAPVLFEDKGKPVLALFTARALDALDPDTGTALWSYPWKTSYDINAADPIILDQKMFLASGYSRGCGVIDFSSGKPEEIWQNKAIKSHFSPNVLLDGCVYGLSGQSNNPAEFVCVDFHSGDVKWEQRGFKVGTVTVVDGKLLILDGEGELVAAEANPRQYREIGRFRILTGKCWTTPAIADGCLLARNAEGDLVCYEKR